MVELELEGKKQHETEEEEKEENLKNYTTTHFIFVLQQNIQRTGLRMNTPHHDNNIKL